MPPRAICSISCSSCATSKSGAVRSTKQNAHDMLQWPLMRIRPRGLTGESFLNGEMLRYSKSSSRLMRRSFQSIDVSSGTGRSSAAPN